jgi:two-component system, NtrC family, nitrogen regulation sensor histidine kinase NtrY
VSDFARAHPEWLDIVRVVPPGEPVWALCDRMLIRRVLSNLVENGIQAAEAAGGAEPPRVVLRVARGRAVVGRSAGDPAGRFHALIEVDDNGPGVAAEGSARVFDPYFTTKESGTGLGLAIVRKIVLDHGGDVTVGTAEAPLGGARFTVELQSPPAPTETTGAGRGHGVT